MVLCNSQIIFRTLFRLRTFYSLAFITITAYRVGTLCAQLLLQIYTDCFEILIAFCPGSKDVH